MATDSVEVTVKWYELKEAEQKGSDWQKPRVVPVERKYQLPATVVRKGIIAIGQAIDVKTLSRERSPKPCLLPDYLSLNEARLTMKDTNVFSDWLADGIHTRRMFLCTSRDEDRRLITKENGDEIITYLSKRIMYNRDGTVVDARCFVTLRVSWPYPAGGPFPEGGGGVPLAKELVWGTATSRKPSSSDNKQKCHLLSRALTKLVTEEPRYITTRAAVEAVLELDQKLQFAGHRPLFVETDDKQVLSAGLTISRTGLEPLLRAADIPPVWLQELGARRTLLAWFQWLGYYRTRVLVALLKNMSTASPVVQNVVRQLQELLRDLWAASPGLYHERSLVQQIASAIGVRDGLPGVLAGGYAQDVVAHCRQCGCKLTTEHRAKRQKQ